MSRDSKQMQTKSAAEVVRELEKALENSAGPETVCAKLAQILHVARHEIALLRLEKRSLRFIYPGELRDAGTIPLSSSAVSARTAVTRTSLLSNSFARVRHVSLFESVKLRGGEGGDESDPMPIQKIMSVPLMASADKVVGVVQISRKGLDPALAGADFTPDDLKLLERAAEIVAQMPFMHQNAATAEVNS
jgi:hypothetical protein